MTCAEKSQAWRVSWWAPLALLTLSACAGGGGPLGPDAGERCAVDSDCDDGVFCNGTELCFPSDPGADSRGCAPALIGPCFEGQRCDDETARCITDCALARDADGDGVVAIECGGTDCDDGNARRYPGNEEVCDVAGVDEDCDPITFGFRDIDGDLYADANCCNGDACGSDCDDQSPTVNPAAGEVCDGLDNDCDGEADEGLVATYFPDRDGDGAGDPEGAMEVCAPPTGFVLTGGDCDDTEPLTRPGAVEACDEVDNDCDGDVDEALARSWWPDGDGDGAGDENASPITACAAPTGHVTNGDDCDDADGTVRPGGGDLCMDGKDNDCDGQTDEEDGMGTQWWPDADGDNWGDESGVAVTSCSPVEGHTTVTGDCDDSDPAIHPGAVERCNGIYDNCNLGDGPNTSEDADGDGHSSPLAACLGGYPRDDCNDADGSVYPGAPELCDRVDNDCSIAGFADPSEDQDDDGFAPTGAACSGGPRPKTDCDDGAASIYPGAPERCNRIDDNCSSGGGVASGEDKDNDGFTRIGHGCSGGPFPKTDCDDNRASVYPGAPEGCNTLDNNCDGNLGTAEDADRDGVARPGCGGEDCDDGDPNIYPGAPERCNRIDDNCSSGGGVAAGEDADGDGYTRTGHSCSGGPLPKTDCDDGESAVNPGAAEICNAVDDDCDGTDDNGCPDELRASGPSTEMIRHLGEIGSGGPPHTFGVFDCPRGALVVGVDYVIPFGTVNCRATPVCATVELVPSGSPPFTRYDATHGATHTLTRFERSGVCDSSSVDGGALCPEDHFLIGTDGGDGVCAPLSVVRSGGAWVLERGTSVQVGEMGSQTRSCPGTGVAARSENVESIAGDYSQLLCRDVNVRLTP